MGAQLSSRSAGGRRRGRRSNRRAAMSDINVTPMVDVMLVLLVIFMVAAPLMTVGVEVDLPETNAAPMTGQDEPLVVSVSAEGTIYIMDSEIAQGTLSEKLAAITDNKAETRIFVRGDKSIDYGRVMEVMGLIKDAGFSKVALIAELPEKGS
ncbi:MAG: protein TolR [Rhodospirillales bacterium]|nr:protein TolR [Rhodospirillales bacterium]